ncbi:MAG: TPM domain-containing protein, partial [Pigmentiphaga sp.]
MHSTALRRFWSFLVLFLCLSGVAWAAQTQALAPIPAYSAPVVDTTSTLTAEQQAGLNARLLALQQRKGAQLAVLLVPSTAPEPIEDYAIRVAEAWKAGRQGIDDGV